MHVCIVRAAVAYVVDSKTSYLLSLVHPMLNISKCDGLMDDFLYAFSCLRVFYKDSAISIYYYM